MLSFAMVCLCAGKGVKGGKGKGGKDGKGYGKGSGKAEKGKCREDYYNFVSPQLLVVPG